MIRRSRNKRTKVGGGGERALGRNTQLLVGPEGDPESSIPHKGDERLLCVHVDRIVLRMHLKGALQPVVMTQLIVQTARRHASKIHSRLLTGARIQVRKY